MGRILPKQGVLDFDEVTRYDNIHITPPGMSIVLDTDSTTRFSGNNFKTSNLCDIDEEITYLDHSSASDEKITYLDHTSAISLDLPSKKYRNLFHRICPKKRQNIYQQIKKCVSSTQDKSTRQMSPSKSPTIHLKKIL